MFTLTVRSTTVHVEEISSNAGPRLRSRLFCLCSMSLNFNRGPTSHDASQKKKEEKKENREKNMVPHWVVHSILSNQHHETPSVSSYENPPNRPHRNLISYAGQLSLHFKSTARNTVKAIGQFFSHATYGPSFLSLLTVSTDPSPRNRDGPSHAVNGFSGAYGVARSHPSCAWQPELPDRGILPVYWCSSFSWWWCILTSAPL